MSYTSLWIISAWGHFHFATNTSQTHIKRTPKKTRMTLATLRHIPVLPRERHDLSFTQMPLFNSSHPVLQDLSMQAEDILIQIFSLLDLADLHSMRLVSVFDVLIVSFSVDRCVHTPLHHSTTGQQTTTIARQL